LSKTWKGGLSVFFTKEKIAKQLSELKPLIYREYRNIPHFKCIEENVHGAEMPEFDDSGWKDFTIGQSWGGYDVTAWFRTIVEIPREWQSKTLALRFQPGPRDGGESPAETLLYINGIATQGIDENHETVWLAPEQVKAGRLSIALKSWSGVLGVPEKRRFQSAQLVHIDEPAEKYFYLADTVLKSIKELDEGDLRYSRLLQVLNNSILKLNWINPRSEEFYNSVAEALHDLQTALDQLKGQEILKPKVIGIGHSHIDMAWLWSLSQTREKASRTFSTVLHLMRKYPEYRYLHTSPQLYKYLKEDYPEIFERVKSKIASGEWEITGGMWIEPDTNVPNGESLIRQILFGKRFMKEEFGVDTNLVWLPDVFGYSWGLPQIIRKSGIERFMTTKISWSQYNRFPHDTFYWKGIDGTELFTHFITTPEEGSPYYTYNGMVDPRSVKGIWEQYRQKDVNDELLLAFGWGDGGGGPTKEMLERGRALKDIPGLPSFEMDKAEPYFDRLMERLQNKSIPVWDGELYLEYHRGTYTTHGWIKRANRKAEVLYHNAEWLNSLNEVLIGKDAYPARQLNNGWEMLLLNQFHDILPGSSIRQVYEDAREDFKKINEIGNQAWSNGEQQLIQELKVDDESIIVFNSLSWEREGIVEVPMSEELRGKTIILPSGEPALSQQINDHKEEKLLLEVSEVPSMGYRTYPLTSHAYIPSKHENSDLYISEKLLENEFFRICLNESGQIISIYDKKADRNVLEEGQRGNVLQTFEDRPMKFDAWDIDLYYQEKMLEIGQLSEAVVEEKGPLRGVLRLKWTFNHSVIIQRLTIYKSIPRIDFRTEADWQEKQRLLKTAFPVSIRSTRATYDIQFGSIERPTHGNTPWDAAKFEVCAQKWADLSEGDYGVSLLNDCKYGHDTKGNVLRLTLIKSPVRPDATADKGYHEFTYSLYPHQGDWRAGDTQHEAYELNVPLTAKAVSPSNGDVPAYYQFASVDTDHVMIETVKKAEQGDALILRVFEYKQCRSNKVSIHFGHEISKAFECNLAEEGEDEVNYQGQTLSFSMNPFEIKTFKVWFIGRKE
jgi:alpha-mannosidase